MRLGGRDAAGLHFVSADRPISQWAPRRRPMPWVGSSLHWTYLIYTHSSEPTTLPSHPTGGAGAPEPRHKWHPYPTDRSWAAAGAARAGAEQRVRRDDAEGGRAVGSGAGAGYVDCVLLAWVRVQSCMLIIASYILCKKGGSVRAVGRRSKARPSASPPFSSTYMYTQCPAIESKLTILLCCITYIHMDSEAQVQGDRLMPEGIRAVRVVMWLMDDVIR